jgi:hypothetical protein
MTTSIPLAVRVVTARQDIPITDRLADLTFRTVVPGGFASARFTIHGPLTFEPDEIALFGRVYVYDARSGATVWEGRLEDPGRSVGSNGQLFEIAALGPSTHARDRTAPLIYVDRRLSELVEATGSGRAYSVGNRESANSTTGALSISAARGNVVTQLSLGAAVYNAVYAAGQDLAVIFADWDGGFSSVNTEVELRTAEDFGGTTTLISTDISTTASTLDARVGGGTAIPAAHNRFLLVLRRSGGDVNPVNDDNYWAEFYNLVVMGTRVNASGAALTSYPGVTVDADEVVADLLGRLLPQYDGPNASIEATSWPIEQLVYPDGASPEQMLVDLMQLEPRFFWEALETNPATGKYRFNWRSWPSTIRYEASAEDGFTSTGSAADLYNSVLVRYRDALGQVRTVQRTQTVQLLTDADVDREGFIDLGVEASTEGNAIQVGDQFLAEHQSAPASGRLTVAHPILDYVTGRMVMPWEIRPGYLIRIPDLNPRPAVLDATDRDGSSVFRIVSVDYSTSDAAAAVELDSPAPSVARRISDILITRPTPGPGPIRRR